MRFTELTTTVGLSLILSACSTETTPNTQSTGALEAANSPTGVHAFDGGPRLMLTEAGHYLQLVGGDGTDTNVYDRPGGTQAGRIWAVSHANAASGYITLSDTTGTRFLKVSKTANDGRLYYDKVAMRADAPSQVSDEAQWKVVDSGNNDGSVYLYSKLWDRTPVAGDSYDGNVYLQDPSGRANARWIPTIQPAGGQTFSDPALFTPGAQLVLTEQAHFDELVAGDTYDGHVYDQAWRARTNAVWIVGDATTGGTPYITLCDQLHNKCLAAPASTDDGQIYEQDPGGDETKWLVKATNAGDGSVNLLSKKWNKALVAGVSYDGHLYHQAPSGASNARWVAARWTMPPPPPSSSDWRMAIAIAYAPLIYLAQDESYLPSSIEFHAGATNVVCNGSRVAGSVLTIVPGALPSNPSTDCAMPTSTALGGAYDYSQPFLHGQDPSRTSVPVYVSIYQESASVFNIEYKTFYPYNYGKNVCTTVAPNDNCLTPRVLVDNHVGDWEGMAIQFTNNVPTAVRVATHEADTMGTTFQIPANSGVLQWSGTHPIVYSASGSHGLWATPGDHLYKKVKTGERLVDHTSQGIPWQTWNNVVQVYSDNTAQTDWYGYSGRWGNLEMGSSVCDLVPMTTICILGPIPTAPCLIAVAAGRAEVCKLLDPSNTMTTTFQLNSGPTTPPARRDEGTLTQQCKPEFEPCTPGSWNPLSCAHMLQTGLAAWYRGEGDARDSAGAASGAIVGDAGYTSSGEAGQAFSFHGSAAGVKLPALSALAGGQATISAWVNSAAVATTQSWIAGGNGRTQLTLGDSNHVQLGFFGADSQWHSVSDPAALPTGQWVHYAGTLASAQGSTTLTLYHDGALVATQTYGVVGAAANGCAAWIGGVRDQAAGCAYSGQYFNGSIDEVRVYNRALASDDVQSLYSSDVAAVPGPAARYRGEGNASDAAGTADGTIMGGVSYTAGQVGQAFALDGGSGAVMLPGLPAIASNQTTISAWINSAAAATAQSWIAGTSFRKALFLSSSNQVTISFFGTDSQWHTVSDPVALPAQQWEHYVATVAAVNGSTTAALYRDGELAAITNFPNVGPAADNGCHSWIGGVNETSSACSYRGQFFNGAIDEVQVFDTELGADQVNGLYQWDCW